MYQPGLKTFLRLSKKGNIIPVHKEINADLDTPVSAFLKMPAAEYSFLLESVEGQEKVARYSFLGSNPSLIFRSKGKNIEIRFPHQKRRQYFRTCSSPLAEIKKIMLNFRPVPVDGLPRFYGGLVGYISYDTARFFEEIPDKNPDDLKLPECLFILTDSMLIFDHLAHTIKIVVNVDLAQSPHLTRKKKIAFYRQAVRKIDSLENSFRRSGPEKKAAKTKARARPLKLGSNFTKSAFKDIVKVAKGYIKKGDIIQVVLSQRFKFKVHQEPFEIYRNLRKLNPSPYMFFLKFKGLHLIGSSPEMLVRCENRIIQARPIAGTRRRGRCEEEDARLEKELLNDRKERAEHIMLVDLGRNDLGRVSQPGKVAVSEFMGVERYSHVMHLVSEVRAGLDKKYDIYDVLKAAFPAGTVTGSPKIRAMEIIDELENMRRGPYAGCVGYFSFSHNMDTCITIRTIVLKDNYAYVQAGAGIVADSVPEREYFETVNKAKALMEAIASVHSGQ
jgi:anthranilate synthase component 1